MTVNFGEVESLLNIVRECALHTSLNHISAAATKKLHAVNDEIKIEAEKETKAKLEAEANDQAKRQAKLAADANAADDAEREAKMAAFRKSQENGDVKPRVFPSDSATDTIADRRM